MKTNMNLFDKFKQQHPKDIMGYINYKCDWTTAFDKHHKIKNISVDDNLKDRVFITIINTLYNSYVIHNLLMTEYFNDIRTLKINKIKQKILN